MNSTPQISTLVMKLHGIELFDYVCTKTVAEQVWLNAYCELFCESDRDFAHFSKVNIIFLFSDGEEVLSLQEIKFSVVIAVK